MSDTGLMIASDGNSKYSQRGMSTRGILLMVSMLGIAALLGLVFDLPIARCEAGKQIPGDFKRIVRMTEVFAHGFGVFVIAAAIWQLAPHLRRHIPRLAICAMLPAGAVQLIKLGIQRVRPTGYINARHIKVLPERIVDSWTNLVTHPDITTPQDDYFFESFPSAHAATVAGLAVALIWLFPKGRTLFVALACLAAFQRVTSGAHWTSDVLAGAALGVLIGGVLTQDWGLGYWLGQFEKRAKEKSPRDET